MSTQKTEHFGLHAWEAGDSFLRSEFNENFAALDEAAWIVSGSYSGNASSPRTISLGFAPRAVFLCERSGKTVVSSGQDVVYGGLALPDNPVYASPGGTAVLLTEDGFTVYSGSFVYTNAKSGTYHYLALR